MTAKAKIAVTLPPHLVKAAKAAVRSGRADNVSAYVAEALEEKVLLDDLGSLLEKMLERTGGPMTAAERRRADRVLDGPKGHRKRPNR